MIFKKPSVNIMWDILYTSYPIEEVPSASLHKHWEKTTKDYIPYTQEQPRNQIIFKIVYKKQKDIVLFKACTLSFVQLSFKNC